MEGLSLTGPTPSSFSCDTINIYYLEMRVCQKNFSGACLEFYPVLRNEED